MVRTIGFTAIFMLYITTSLNGSNDAFIIAVVALHAIFSGYASVVIYEVAAAEFSKSHQRQHAVLSLNVSFLTACTAAAICTIVTLFVPGLFRDSCSY